MINESILFEDEEYRQIQEAPDYFVSKNGVVISKRTSNPKPIKIKYDPHGNKIVVLRIGNNYKIPMKLNILVARTWVKNIKDIDKYVRYKDGNKDNCSADNLEWVDCRFSPTQSINMSFFEWTELKRYPNYYICPEGHVIYKKNGISQLLYKYNNRKGLLYVNFGRDTEAVHRLVAETFIPNPNCFTYVIFKDGDRTNLNVDNLEWSNMRMSS